MPILITLRAFLGNTIARIGGWLVAGISVLAVLKWRDWSARRQGRAEVETAVREAALRKALSEISGDDSVCTQDNVLPIGSGSSTSSDLGSLKNADGSPFDKSHINPNFGKPVAYQPPRSFRFGAKVTF